MESKDIVVAEVAGGDTDVILDLSTIMVNRDRYDAYFLKIEEKILRASTGNVLIVMTPVLHDRLPRRFDGYGQRMRVVQACGSEAREVITRHATSRTLVISPARAPYERWAAMDPDDTLTIEPADALERFARDGTLGAIPEVSQPLSRVADQAPGATPYFSPTVLRRLAFALAAGTSPPNGIYPPTASVRLAWAKALGVEAAATPSEWGNGLGRRVAPVLLTKGSERSLARAQLEARFMPDYTRVLDIYGTLHVINPNGVLEAELADEPEVVTHVVHPDGRLALEAMLSEAAVLTLDDFTEDAELRRLTKRHCVHELDQPVFESARLALLTCCEAWVTARVPVPAPLDGLAHLLRECPQVHAPRGVRVASRVDEHWESWIVPGEISEVSFSPPPVDGALITRGQRSTTTVGMNRYDRAGWPSLGADARTWLSSVLTWWFPAESMPRESEPRASMQLSCAKGPTLTREFWSQVDRLWAFVRAALANACARPSVLSLPDGACLLSLGQGIFAELRAYARRASEDEEFAELAAVASPKQWSYDGDLPHLELDHRHLEHLISTHEAVTQGYGTARTTIGVRVPHGVRIGGSGWCVDVTFRASGFFASTPTPSDLACATSGAASLDAAEKAADVAARDDDDD